MENKMPITKDVDNQFKDLLFTTRFNTPLNSQVVSDAISRIISEINVTRDYLDEMETFSAHCFRHTFATRCFESRIQPKVVQSYLGHATLQMTMDLYTSVMPKHMIAEMDKISDVMDTISNSSDEIVEKKFNSAKNVKQFPVCDDSMVV